MGLGKIAFKNLSRLLGARSLYLTKSLTYREEPQKLSTNFDYVRYATLGLCYENIVLHNVKGNIAELGVYRGDFASRLNQLFFDRSLYLFDTFEGFSNTDIAIEKQKEYSKGNQDFSKTSIDLVLKKMKYPDNCIIKKGFFPDTANDVSEQFCFVSIDADLYEPIYNGLQFFYPKLVKGGYIFVHDYNNESYKGAKQAVIDYCSNKGINFVPIPDSGGTIIITK